MGIVNCTPDSFYDAGRTATADQAKAAVRHLLADGADAIDVGGLAFSPLVPDLGESSELDRVLPVIRHAVDLGGVVSVDTWRVGVARAAVAEGAQIINDTSGLADPDMAALAAETSAKVIITHSLATPHTTLAAPRYDDVVNDVKAFLTARVDVALANGVSESRIIVDPGHDLNKNTLHSLELTRRIDEIVALGFPVLVAVSNKDFIGETLDLPKEQRVSGSLGAAAYCLAKGVRMVRMHNVAEAVQVTRLIEAIEGWKAPISPLRHNMN